MRNVQYTRSWVVNNLEGKNRVWSSSEESLHGSADSSDMSDIPPYDSSLAIPALTTSASVMVASMKAVDSVTEAESAELPKTARKSRGDDVPGLPSQRRPDDDEGSGDSVQTTSSDSVIFNDDPRFVANNGTPTTAVSPTRNHFRKLRPINTLLRRPYRNSVLKAPPVVSS
ncbi:hypothetical protein B0H10DRAFT_2198811 [Mycena sp. CBHHK59/15]|nr:hypothetical protein B0H10DRAFT_2198811 [Mycena sp. CBHHK59/15]